MTFLSKKKKSFLAFSIIFFLACFGFSFVFGQTSSKDTTPPFISNMAVTNGKTGAVLLWNTNEPTVYTYFWGETDAYETGSGSDNNYSIAKKVILSPVSVGTTYYYKIESRDFAGNSSIFSGTFTVDGQSDTNPPANPTSFKATPSDDTIVLTWVNPKNSDFTSVEVARSKTTFPSSPASGNLIYEGGKTNVIDKTPEIGVKYYYAIFAKDTSENYSSGAFASAKISLPKPPATSSVPVIPLVVAPKSTTTILIKTPVVSSVPTTTPIIPPSTVKATSTKITKITPVASTTSPITTVSTAIATPTVAVSTTTTQPQQPLQVQRVPHVLSLSDFVFFAKEGKKETKISLEGDTVPAYSSQDMRIAVSSEKLPVGSRSVILKINNFIPGQNETSFALLPKDTGAEREMTLDLNGVSGFHSFTIDIHGINGKSIGSIVGTLMLDSAPPPLFVVKNVLPPTAVKQTVSMTEKVAPSALPVGIAVGVSQSVMLMTNIGSFYDVYLIALKFFGILLGLFGRRRPKAWGVVYDSVTKRPIDPAYVVMEDIKGEKKKRTAITDLDGRYGFLSEPGAYSISVNKTNYKFPSQIMSGRTRDEMYDDLYFGEIFETTEHKIIQYNVPMDPIGFDWNEFIKNKENIFNLYSRNEKIRSIFFNGLFIAGFLLSIVAILFVPSVPNFALIVLYLGIIAFQSFWKSKHKITVLLGKDGKPISFAIVSAEISGLSIPIVKKVTTDMFGRFYFLMQPGVYDIKVQEKQPDGTYQEIYRMPSLNLKKGVLTENIVVKEQMAT